MSTKLHKALGQCEQQAAVGARFNVIITSFHLPRDSYPYQDSFSVPRTGALYVGPSWWLGQQHGGSLLGPSAYSDFGLVISPPRVSKTGFSHSPAAWGRCGHLPESVCSTKCQAWSEELV